MSKQRFVGLFQDKEHSIDLQRVGNGRYLVDIDQTRHVVDAQLFEGGTWSLIIDGHSYDVELEVSGKNESEGQYVSLVRGSVMELRVQDERRNRLRFRDSLGPNDGPQLIKAPMPGKIIKIFVQEGESVSENQPVIVIEAMKMENELRAASEGTVSRIMVAEGDTVEGNSKLITIT